MLVTAVVQDIETENVCYIDGDIYERETPCSTFKIALAAMGFACGILENETAPTWHFQEGYDVYRESWRSPQNPTTWIANSCVWYSQVLVSQMDLEGYTKLLNYGNCDVSGDLSWIGSTLKISPKEQVDFITKLVKSELPLSQEAQELTRKIFFYKEIDGMRIYGKTGSNCRTLGWFVGWVEKNKSKQAFACLLKGPNLRGSDAREHILSFFVRESQSP